MALFITGTDTNIGKTLISAWLCLHTNAAYFKPIQTGSLEGTDSKFISKLTATKIYPERYLFSAPLSPHLAAELENTQIDPQQIQLPTQRNLVVEGAGGVLVPIHGNYCMIDLIKDLNLPVLIVASSRLGTINHTSLTIAALRQRQIPILGVILNGPRNLANKQTIEQYNKINVLAELPWLEHITQQTLQQFALPETLLHTIKPYL